MSADPPPSDPIADADPPTISVEAMASEVLRAFAERRGAADAPEAALDLDPDRIEQDLARLVLALVEFIRQLLEAQAIRRMERGRLTEEEEERLGLTLMRARERLVEIAAQFGISEEELTLDLGALGRLC